MRIYINQGRGRLVRYAPLYRQRRRILAHLVGAAAVLLALLWVLVEFG